MSMAKKLNSLIEGSGIKKAVNTAEKKVESVGKKVADVGGSLIANYVATSPTANRYAGILADEQRQKVTRRRESRENDKAQGY